MNIRPFIKQSVMPPLIAMILLCAGPLFAAELQIWTDKKHPTFKTNGSEQALKIAPTYDPAAEARRTAGRKSNLWFEVSGNNVQLLIERLEFDEKAPDMLRPTLIVFNGPVQNGMRYTMPFGGETETMPSLRITATDERGSVIWNNTYDGYCGSTYFKYSNENRTEEFKALARSYYQRHNQGRIPPIVDVNMDGQVEIHLYEIVEDNKTTSHTATWNRYSVMEHTGCGEDISGTEINLYE